MSKRIKERPAYLGLLLIPFLLLCSLFLIEGVPSVALAVHQETETLDLEQHQEWIIKWKTGQKEPNSSDFEKLMVDPARQLMLIRLHEDVDNEAWYKEWSKRSDIEYLEPDLPLKISTRPNDPELSKQTYLNQIQAFDAWQVERENRGITIAILDTGVDLTHPDLKDNLVPGINLIERTKAPQDDNGHGTQLAGVLAAKPNNNQGVAGILWSAKVMPVKVLNKEGEGTPFRVAQGIYQSIEKGVSIVLLSLGDPVYTQTLQDAVAFAEQKGVLVVAATGNEGSRVNYPAAFPTVLAVGAVDAQDRAESYSNSGPEVSVVAPGRVYTTRLKGSYGQHSGTSLAAPQVAGLAGLIWKKHPHLTPSELRNHIFYTSKKLQSSGWDARTGHGRIDMSKALRTNPVADIYETNNLVSKAAPFPIENMVRSQLKNKEDVDWFWIDAPYRGKLNLRVLLDVAKTNGVDVNFYPGGQIQGDSFLYNIKKEREIELNVPKGRSLIRLKYNQGERRTTPLNYEMVNSFTIYEDKQQPNQSKAYATKLAGNGQVLTGTFPQDNIEHWYFFDVPSSGQIDLQINVDTLRLDPVLLVEKGNVILEKVDQGNAQNNQEERYISIVEPGRYYFRVSNYFGHKVNGEYFLRFTYKPYFVDPYEPNNYQEVATRVQSGTSYQATIDTLADVDWYQLQVNEERYLQVNLSSIPQGMGVEAKLYNQQRVLLASHQQKGSEASFELGDKVAPGTYYLQISANRAFPFDSYILKPEAQALIAGYRDIQGHWAQAEIVRASEQELISGLGNYRFGPNMEMSRAAVSAILRRWVSFPEAQLQEGFKDVPVKHWAHQAIAQTSQAGIIRGYPNGTFQPEKSITRAEAAVIFDRLLFNNVSYRPVSYQDVSSNHWAYTSIMRLSAHGLLSGYKDGTFRPDQVMTRAEFVALLNRASRR